ncbi:MAG: class I SAM-dependent methyltransferase [Gammaproteobacteria bacterium]|nr:class I SAM-dependent methyltransferase [Gammaproteobacteria bacterium]
MNAKPVLHHRVAARRYADAFALRPADAPPPGPGVELYYDEQGMALVYGGERRLFRLRLAPIKARAGQSLLLARACGAGKHPSVADLFAGWGTDGLSLALKGCAVTLVERSPLVWALLDDLIVRHALPATVVRAEAGAWCRAHRRDVDVAYLDPMFPPRRKQALPDKSMQLLRGLAEPDGLDLAEHLEQAKAAARQRVVVKRRLHDPAAGQPAWQLRGGRIRFDVYRV